MKNQKGVTMVSLVVTIILMIIISGTMIYSSTSVFNLEAINDMYVDIRNLDEKVTMYYLNNSTIPIKREDTGVPKIIEVPEEMSINPNDSEFFYELDLSLLSNLSLNYSVDTDVYVINSQSHTIYFLPGIETDDGIVYTIPIEYTKIEDF